MNNVERSYQIWNRIDLLKGDISLNSLADKIGVKYQRMKEQRSSGRVPSADDLYRIAKALNSTMEYIYAGEGVGVISEEARLVDDDPELQALVRAIMRDRELLRIISAVVESSEKSIGAVNGSGY